MIIFRSAIVLLTAILAASSSIAHTTSGRLTTSFYVFERNDSTNVESTHSRAYQTVQLSHKNRDMGVHFYGQVDDDFSTHLVNDTKVRTYSLYLEWKNLARRVDVRVGRQPVFAGVATGTVDGAQIRLDATRWLWVKGFGGGLLPADQEVRLIDDLDQNYMVGGQAVATPTRETRISVSYLDKRQLRSGFNTLRADTVGNLFTQFIEPSERAFELGALDASWTFRPEGSLSGRLDYDFHQDRFTRGEVSARSDFSQGLTLRSAYTYRSPRVPGNSIFSIFDVDENHEAEVGFAYRYRPSLRFHGEAAGIFYTGDESYRGALGFNTSYGGLDYVRRGGFAGDLDGVNVSVFRVLRQGQLTPKLQASWASYRVADRGDRDDIYAGSAGLTFRPRGKFSIDGEVQVLRNRYYDSDVRFLLRLQYRFFKKWVDHSSLNPDGSP